MEYIIAPKMYQQHIIAVVGCGGTGGFVAEAVCRLMMGTPGKIILIDPDDVEPHNLLRQNFQQGDVGQNKALTLARRLSDRYRRPVTAIPQPYPEGRELEASYLAANFPGVIIGCVDNGGARKAISESLDDHSTWWIDAGNDRDWGQVLVGNSPVWGKFLQDNAFERQVNEDGITRHRCHALPGAVVQQPELLVSRPNGESRDRDCAQAILLQDQDPVINQTMAALAVSTLYRIMTGKCGYMAQYLNLNTGTLSTTQATPENTARFLTPSERGD